jgi:glycosyltransferase involved in cell wall biosynthesis
MSTVPVVSVVVPVRNGAELVGGCLDALAAQEQAPPYEVIVVDNGSTDGTADVVRRHPLGVRLVAETKPGSYAARNAGIGVASGRVIAFTDADCLPVPTWLAAAVAAVDAGADLVGGRVTMTRSIDPSVVERYDSAVYLRQEDLVTQHGWAVTANLAVRRRVLDDAGWFDPALPSGGDREFCLRAGAHGHRLVYAPDAAVLHRPRTRLGEVWRVNRRIGSGFHRLAARTTGRRPWRLGELRQPLEWVVQCVADDGPPLRRRQLAPVHTVAMVGRWIGLVTGR